MYDYFKLKKKTFGLHDLYKNISALQGLKQHGNSKCLVFVEYLLSETT